MSFSIFLSIAMLLASNCNTGFLTEAQIERKNDLAVFAKNCGSTFDKRIEFSQQEQAYCKNLEIMLGELLTCQSAAEVFQKNPNIISKIKSLDIVIFLRGNRPNSLYTGTLIAHLFSAFTNRLEMKHKLLAKAKNINQLYQDMHKELCNTYSLLRILRVMDYQAYDFGIMFELFAFGSKKLGEKEVVEDYYSYLLEKLTKRNARTSLFELIKRIDPFFAYQQKCFSHTSPTPFINNVKAKSGTIHEIFANNRLLLENAFVIKTIRSSIELFERELISFG